MVDMRLLVKTFACGCIGKIVGVNTLAVDGSVGEANTSEADENFALSLLLSFFTVFIGIYT